MSFQYTFIHAFLTATAIVFYTLWMNIWFVKHKFYEINDLPNGNRIDISGISETKINAPFKNAQFNILGFKLHRQDRDLKGNSVVSLCTLKTQFIIVYYVSTQISLMVSSICRLKFALKSLNGSFGMYISLPRSEMIVHGASSLIWLIVLSTTKIFRWY